VSLEESVGPTLHEKPRSGMGVLESTEEGRQLPEADASKVNDVVLPRKGRNSFPRSYVKEQRSLNSGPWSVDWLHNLQKGDVGLISSRTKRLRTVAKVLSRRCESHKNKVTKRKAGGVLRHPVFTLKKVARLPSKDRQEVMKVLRGSKSMKCLKQKISNRRHQREKIIRSLETTTHNSNSKSGSMASVNNDWTNWVVLRGNEETKADDIQGIGKTLGISFGGNNHNKFSILS